MILLTTHQKPLSQFPPNFKLILLLKCDWEFVQMIMLYWLFFFITKNCLNDDPFISCSDRIGKMLHNICISAVAMSLRWASHGLWTSCFPYINLCRKLKIFLSETTGPISIYHGRNVSLLTLYQDCSSHHCSSKNMATREWGLYFYISI